MKPKCEIGFSLQVPEHSRKQGVWIGSGPKSKFLISMPYAKIKSDYFLRSQYGFPSVRNSNVLIASVLACSSLRGYN